LETFLGIYNWDKCNPLVCNYNEAAVPLPVKKPSLKFSGSPQFAPKGACPLLYKTPYLINERECVSFSHDNGIKIAKVRALDFASKFFQGPSANLSMRRCTSGLQRIISFPSELNSWFGGRGFSSAHRLSRSMGALVNESHVRFLFFSDYSYIRCAVRRPRTSGFVLCFAFHLRVAAAPDQEHILLLSFISKGQPIKIRAAS
jgi:hypothetical protein